MGSLDDKKILDKYNKSKVADTIAYLPEQIKESWEEVLEMKLPKKYKNFSNIVVCGMGGSNLATELVRSVYGREMKIPFILVRNYKLPAYVNSKSLVIISSYSGNTEETVSCLKDARTKKAKIFCMASGGRVISTAKRNKIPYYKINKRHNPGNQPRYGVGSQFGATLALLNKLGLVKISNKDIKEAVEYIFILNKAFDPEINTKENIAKGLAVELKGSLPILVAADFLNANTHILNNQINESAKNVCVHYPIPELNHHLMEGLKLPITINDKIKFLFFNSNLYFDRIKKRFDITQKVLKKQKIEYIDYSISGDSRLLAALEILLLGSWISYYMTILNSQNPVAIPYVDYFKEELKK